jgi:phosphate starvation-inducible PhoH-like protein
MGKHAKFIITGDPGQIDLPRKVSSGLKEALYILKDVEGIGMLYLDDKDIVRHRLVKKIVDAYKISEERPDKMSIDDLKKMEGN